MVAASFKPRDDILTHKLKIVPERFTLSNFRYVLQYKPIGRQWSWHPGDMIRAARNSLLYAAVATASTLITSSMAGYALAKRRFRGDKLTLAIVVAALVVPDPTVIAPNYLIMVKLNLLDSFTGLILPNLTSAFAVLLCRQWMMGIPDDLVECARMDGASEAGVYVHVIVPLSKPILAVVGPVVFLWRWHELAWPMSVVASPHNELLTEVVAGMHRMLGQGWGEIMAAVALSSLPLLVLYLLFDDRFVDGLVRESVRVVKSLTDGR
jgi:ABC-type glycerol-3-phosphate transport system permease component